MQELASGRLAAFGEPFVGEENVAVGTPGIVSSCRDIIMAWGVTRFQAQIQGGES